MKLVKDYLNECRRAGDSRNDEAIMKGWVMNQLEGYCDIKEMV